MADETQSSMARYRAIMTTKDRERIQEDDPEDPSLKYQCVSRVRNRIKELETDVEILEKEHPELLQELRETVCEQE